MNWFTSAWHAVTHPSQLISDGEHWLGQVSDEGAHLVGRGLTDVGLGQVGNVVDGWGDDAASALDPELQLGQTDDPTQLIHGSPGAIRQTASSLHQFSGAFGQTASGLGGIDTTHWTGSAAAAFQAKYAPQPGKWRDASTASGNAGGALESYAGTVEWAQGQAREAISVYAEGQKATAAAVTAYNDQVAAYNAAAQQYDAKLSAGQNPGVRPTEPGAFSDPRASLRERAQQMLTAARAERDRAGSAAASVVSKATGLAPASPGLWSQVGDTLTDGEQFTNLAQASFASGILTGVADIGKVVRDVNPEDPWNMTHPAEYLAGLSAVGAGIVHDAVHPQDLVGQMVGGGWGSDPFDAAGKLVPQVALALATDGGGTAADAAGDAATDVATSAGTDLGGTTADDAAAGAARAPGDMTTAGDPVDVATGDVILSHVDAAFPGALTLAVARVHRSSYRGGRWFGRSWASTLDQRLVVTGNLVVFAAEDGMVLCYPRPADDGVPVLPVAGPRWPLVRERGGYTVTDPQARLVRRFTQRAGFYLSGAGEGEMPLVSLTGGTGHKIRFQYGPDGEPQSVTHDGGYHLKIIIGGGRVTGLVLAGAGDDDADLTLVRYAYHESGDLAEVVNSSGQPLRLSYDEAGRLTRWTDRNDWSYSYHYDADGRCVRGEGPGGTLSGTFSYDHDATGRLVTTHTDPAGAVTTYQITARSQVTAVTNPAGSTSSFEHDPGGQLISRADPLGRVTRWAYDPAGNLISVTRPDESGAAISYGELNLPIVITQPGGAVWRQEYDSAGNLTRRTGPDGAITGYAYDQHGHLAAITDPMGATTHVECDLAGLPVSVTDPGGALTQLERDRFGRVTAIFGPDGEATRLAWTPESRLSSRVLPGGATEQYSYDGEGNLTAHLDAAGGLTRFEYGCFDRVTARSAPDGTRTEFGYDHALRLATVQHGSLIWRYEYDQAGRLAAETNYNGAHTRYAYDAAGQLVRRQSAAGDLSYSYDPLGNISERGADGAVSRFGYDPAGRLARAASPEALIEFERDAAGRVTAETCNGRTISSAYDAAGRRTRRVTPSGADTRWAYDAAGRPAGLSCAGGELRFGYDQAGQEVLRELPGGATLAQEWGPAGQLAVQVLTGAGPSGVPQPAVVPGRVLQHRSYRYRADGVLTGLNDLLSGPRRLTLDQAGLVTGVTGPDWAETYSYFPGGNIAAAAWPAPPGPAAIRAGADAQGPREYAGTLITRAGAVRYQHDQAGRIILRQRTRDSRKPETWRYQWDAEDRLTAVTTPDGTTWRYLYDPLGRRIAKLRLAQDGSIAAITEFTWDGPVVAEQATLAAPAAAPPWPGDTRPGPPGTAGDQVITWDYQPGTGIALTQAERTIRGDGQDVTDQRFYAIVTDLIGTPSELTGPDGSLAGYQQRTLWGTTVWHPGGAATPLRFPGQYEDPETGLHYNHHRYYDPATGRYLSPDPLGLDPGPDPHAYVPNPTLLADPLGLEGCGISSTATTSQNQAAIDALKPGDGMSGIYDPATGRFTALPSGDAEGAVLPRLGGHATLNMAAFGDSRSTVAFTAIVQEDGSLELTWLSRGVNGRNFGDFIAPANQQQAIINAVAKATGRTVTG